MRNNASNKTSELHPGAIERGMLLTLLTCSATPACAHSGPPAILAYLLFGVAPLLLSLLVFCVYLLFSRFSAAQRMRLLGLFVLVAGAFAALTYFPANEAGYLHSYLMWVAPLIVVPLLARRLPHIEKGRPAKVR